MDLLQRALVGAVASGAVAAIAYRRGSLTPGGTAAGFAVGEVIYVAGGAPLFAALLTFFVTSTLLGRVGAARKEATKQEFSKTDRRDSLQVLANGGIAALCAAAYGALAEPLFAAGFLGALATATGDTWATELGTLAKGPPRSIRTLRTVPTGTSGAVSALGLGATLAGAASIGTIAALAPAAFGLAPMVGLSTATVGGFLGATGDSFVGATFQARFRCTTCQVDTEGELHHCGTPTLHRGGLRALGNDGVNALATSLGAATAMALYRLL